MFAAQIRIAERNPETRAVFFESKPEPAIQNRFARLINCRDTAIARAAYDHAVDALNDLRNHRRVNALENGAHRADGIVNKIPGILHR